MDTDEVNLTEEEALQIAVGSLGEHINALRYWLQEARGQGRKSRGVVAQRQKLARMVAARNLLDDQRARLRVDRVMGQVREGVDR